MFCREYDKSGYFCHHQPQNNWKSCFDLIICEGLAEDLNSCNDRLRISCPPPPHGGGVLVVKSDYKNWVQIKGSSVLTCHMGLWLLWFSPHHLHLQHLTSSTSPEKE
jgi:hypothetical protein